MDASSPMESSATNESNPKVLATLKSQQGNAMYIIRVCCFASTNVKPIPSQDRIIEALKKVKQRFHDVVGETPDTSDT